MSYTRRVSLYHPGHLVYYKYFYVMVSTGIVPLVSRLHIMFGNPYGQGNWYNHRLSPTFGALPHYIPVLSPNIITFLFASHNQDILNTEVTDANFQRSYRITTNKCGLGDTMIKRADGDISGIIDWQRHPEVEMLPHFQKQRASVLFPLSPDGRGRLMNLQNKQYIWMTSGDFIYLHPWDDIEGEPLAKITKIPQGVLLEITTSAVQAELLDVTVVVTVLLQSGRCF